MLFSKPEGSVRRKAVGRHGVGTDSDVLLCIPLQYRVGGGCGQESPHLTGSWQPGEGAEVKGRHAAVESLL